MILSCLCSINVYDTVIGSTQNNGGREICSQDMLTLNPPLSKIEKIFDKECQTHKLKCFIILSW